MAKQNIRSDCNKHITKREHYARKNGDWKPKQKFEHEEDALAFIKKHKMYKYTAYICKVCGKWHIGIKFYHVMPNMPIYKVGDRIGQIKLGITMPIYFEWVGGLSDTERGTGGYGSTGK